MKRLELIVAVLSAMLAFIGALAGVFLASRLDQNNWQQRYEAEQSRTLLQSRVATMERVVTVINKAPLMVGLQASLAAEHKKAEMAVACAAANLHKQTASSSCKGLSSIGPERVESLGREIFVLGAEYAAAASLAAIYFGPKTRDALAQLSKAEWWKADSNTTRALMQAMGEELAPAK